MKGIEFAKIMSKVKKVLSIFENEHVSNLTVIKHNVAPPTDLNLQICEAEAKINVPIVQLVANDGAIYNSALDF
jgi:hypothetical protein